jgi:hypothetical protein
MEPAKLIVIFIAVLSIAILADIPFENVIVHYFGQSETSHSEEEPKTKVSDFQEDLRYIATLTESRDITALVQFSKEVEKKWSNNLKYRSRLLAEISNSFSTYNFHDNIQYKYSVALATKVLQNADDIPIDLEYEMVSKLRSTTAYSTGVESSEKWENDRSQRIIMILHLWNRVEKGIDRNFDVTDIKNRPVGNLIVPGGAYPSGVNPDDVKEPDLREKYLARIAANQVKAEKFNLQIKLRQLDDVLPKFIEQAFFELYSLEPKNSSELRKNLDLFGLDEKSKKRILESLVLQS